MIEIKYGARDAANLACCLTLALYGSVAIADGEPWTSSVNNGTGHIFVESSMMAVAKDLLPFLMDTSNPNNVPFVHHCDDWRTMISYDVANNWNIGYCYFNYAANPNGQQSISWPVMQCAPGYHDMGGVCVTSILRRHHKDTCPKYGDPISPLSGSRRQTIDLGISVGGESLTITYDSVSKTPSAGQATWLPDGLPSFGSMWQSSLHKAAIWQGTGVEGIVIQRGADFETTTSPNIGACSPSGANNSGSNTTFVSTIDPNTRVSRNGTNGNILLVDGTHLTEEIYALTNSGQPSSNTELSTVSLGSGGQLTYTYTNYLLTSIADSFGRFVTFAYEQPGMEATGLPAPRITSVTAPDGSKTQFSYDTNNNLQTITWPDGNYETLLYERSDIPWALTGIIDEQSGRYGTYGYDSTGLANSTFVGQGVNKYTVSYASPPTLVETDTYVSGMDSVCRDVSWAAASGIVVTGPNLQADALTSTVSAGLLGLSSHQQSAGSGCASSSSNISYDSAGNVTSKVDFNGNRTCYAYDISRNLPVVVLSGLAASKPCPADLAGYQPLNTDPAHPERKVSSAWHPLWSLKMREAQPKKVTTWVYNGQTDPIAGDIPNCAPDAPGMVVDSAPIPVLCRRYEQSTTDASGGLGFGAAGNGAQRAWTYTYNKFGQVLTETAPAQSSTDLLPHTTTYTYYSDTSMSGNVGHTLGDLHTVKNPLGQLTTYTTYDGAGRLLSSTDANGTITTQTYLPRGWLQSRSVVPLSGAALTTTYAYWPTGLLKTATMPDATTLNYTYDDAHRLTDVVDGAGNRLHYVLDNAGNRTSEQLSDVSGNLANTVARVYDALNRVQSLTGAMQ